MATNFKSILRISDLTRLTSLSRTTIYRSIKAGIFPKPLKIGLRRIGWKSKDVFDFLNSPAHVKTIDQK